MNQAEFKPYVPEETNMREFTFKAMILGVGMAVVLGAANAYLGLRAGMTVAAAFPAAVVAMAVLRVFKGNILEENMARTTASVGEALVAGAIFTIPAFVMVEIDGAPLWETIYYWKSTMVMLVGGFLGVLFVTLLRRSMVQEANLPFPEAVACAEIVKAGQKGGSGAKYVFGAMGLAALMELFKNGKAFQLFSSSTAWIQKLKTYTIQGKETIDNIQYDTAMFIKTPDASPAFIGVGYIIGPQLAALAFSGGIIAWMVLVPMLLFFNPELVHNFGGDMGSSAFWNDVGGLVYGKMVRPIAVGTMIVAAFFTLFKMRGPLITGIGKAVTDMKASASGTSTLKRTDRDIPLKTVLIGVAIAFVAMIFVYQVFSGSWMASIVSAIVLLIAGFLFAAVSSYLVGIVGSSSNPVSGLTLSALVIAAILMVALGVKGGAGVAAVLGVAGVVCCVAAVAGDMLQDLKVGHILGGTPWKMQVGELIGAVAAAMVMAGVILMLHKAYTLGSPTLSAPQAGLMALMAKGIVTGQMAWPLIIFGMFFGVGLIVLGAPSPMLIAIGIYLPIEVTAAMMVGGIFKWVIDSYIKKRKLGQAAKEKAANTGILLASGLVAGEALVGVLIAAVVIMSQKFPALALKPICTAAWPALIAFAVLGYVLIYLPIANATKKD